MTEMTWGLLAITGLGVALTWYWHTLNYALDQAPRISGDSWHMRRMAGTGERVSAPYAWRRTYPWLARILGFRVVNYTCVLVGPTVFWLAMGRTPQSLAVGLLWLLSPQFSRFFLRSWDYADGFNMLVAVGAVALARVDTAWAWVAAAVGAFTRETIVVLVAAVAAANQRWGLAAFTCVCGMLAYLTRREADPARNKHPLLEMTRKQTLLRWIKTKGDGAVDYAHTWHLLGATVFGLPFVWGNVAHADRTALVLAIIPIWWLSLWASAQTRSFTFILPLLFPFANAASAEWVWFIVLLAIYWPWIRYQLFDESGGQITIDPVEGASKMVDQAAAARPTVLPLPPPSDGKELGAPGGGGDATVNTATIVGTDASVQMRSVDLGVDVGDAAGDRGNEAGKDQGGGSDARERG